MRRDGSASETRRQGQHPKPFGLTVHQCAHVLSLVSVWRLDLRLIRNHKFCFFIEECFQCFPRIDVLQEALDAFLTGGFLAHHPGCYPTEPRRASFHDPLNNLTGLFGCPIIAK